MRKMIVSERYAEAYVAFAREGRGIEEITDEFKELRKVARENPGFLKFLSNPGFSPSEKSDFIEVALKSRFSEELRTFLKLLARRNRIQFLVEIADYIRVKYSHGDVVDAVVKASYPMDTTLLKKLKACIEKKTGKRTNMYMELDPTLLGGVQVTLKNIVIDGSLRRRLEDLKNRLNARAVA